MTTRRPLIALPLLAFVPMLEAQASGAALAARRLVQASSSAQRAELLQPFTDPARGDWHYTPRRRSGVAWKAMSAPQREAATALLRTAMNERGLDKVRALMALEITLRQLETFGLSRDPENYAVAVFGITCRCTSA
jgi:hypothetical protein